ncbi:DUF2934 domain-containing protein [Paracoccus liaowanqingii]
MDDERTQKVRDRAHALWEQAGRPQGQDAEHWSQVKREIAAEGDAGASAPAAKVRGWGRKATTTGSEVAEAPKARRGRPPKAAAEAATEPSADAPKATRGRKPKAVAEEGDVPKAKRGRKPKVVAEGTDAAE